MTAAIITTNVFSRCAALALLLVVLSVRPCSASYAEKAEEITDYIQNHFYDSANKRYWRECPSNHAYAFTWANGIELYALAEAVKSNPKKYGGVLYDFTNGLQSYWDTTVAIPCYSAYCSEPGGTEEYYDDNEWMVLAFVDAYQATDDRKFLTLAAETQKFVLSGWDDTLGGGIYWRVDHRSKNTCSNAPAAAAALELADSDGDESQVQWAIKIRNWVNTTLQDTDGLYFDNIDLRGRISKTKWSYNSALMISTDLLLYTRFKDPSYLQEAQRIADAGLVYWTDPVTGSLQNRDDGPFFTHLFCKSLLELYQADHNLKYLNAVRREASFAYRYCRDPQGGYWDKWTTEPHPAGQTKTLMSNASAAYLFWILAPYQDVDTLKEEGAKAAAAGNYISAAGYFSQAADSDPRDRIAGVMLYQALTHEHKLEAASDEAKKLAAIQAD